MRILWVCAHPEPRSLNAALRKVALRTLTVDGHEVRSSDLYAMDWNPVVTAADFRHEHDRRLHIGQRSRQALEQGTLAADILAEQRKLNWADALVVQFPLWWYGMPAILEGWFDRVFVEGYGYGVRGADCSTRRYGDTAIRRYGDGMLAGKRALTVVSFGGARTVSGRAASTEQWTNCCSLSSTGSSGTRACR